MDRPIPSFYCCYLLRSVVSHGLLYVGSTPNPRRRLRQHNGATIGGAKRTSSDDKRPWQMTVIVYGFPSKIAALQFEWAWQHPNLTRHIDSNQRITISKNKSNGRPRRVHMGLTEYLANMQLLLGSDTFGRWPLNVKFFARDVYDNWMKKVPDFRRSAMRKLPMPRPGITFRLEPADATTDPKPPAEMKKIPMGERMDMFEAWTSARALYGLEVSYEPYKATVSKSSEVVAQADHSTKCAVCQQPLEPCTDLVLHCATSNCLSQSHLACLASHFLNEDGGSQAIVPTSGSCPDCQSSLAWKDLMMDLSLRQRGQDEIQRLKKEPKVKKSRGNAGQCLSAEADEVDEDAGTIDEGPDYDASFAELGPGMTASLDASDSESLASSERKPSLPVKKGTKRRKPVVKEAPMAVVADSEWDDIEEIT